VFEFRWVCFRGAYDMVAYRRQEREKGISQKSCQVLTGMGPQIQWVESFVTQDKIYCVYIAPNEAEVLEHAKQGGFPADSVSEVKQMIDPTTAE